MKNLALSCVLLSGLQYLVVARPAEYHLRQVAFGRVETDELELQNFPEIEAFVQLDLPLYERMGLKIIPRAQPELVLIDAKGRELDRLPLGEFDRQLTWRLLQELGFQKTTNSDTDTRYRRVLRGHFIKYVKGDDYNVFGEMDLV